MAQRKMLRPVEPIEQRQGQRNRRRGDPEKGSGKPELRRVHQPTGQKPEESAHWIDPVYSQTRFPQQVFKPMPGIAEVIVRLLMFLPFKGSNEKQPAASPQDASQFSHHERGFADMLEGDDVYAGIEGIFGERKMLEIPNCVKVIVLPGLVSDAEIDGDVPVICEAFGVLRFAGSSVEHSGSLR